jgi:hypothetical protein
LQIKAAIEIELAEMQLQPVPHIITKIIQLYETKTSRHSVMIVGSTLSGKTVSWKTLQVNRGWRCFFSCSSWDDYCSSVTYGAALDLLLVHLSSEPQVN